MYPRTEIRRCMLYGKVPWRVCRSFTLKLSRKVSSYICLLSHKVAIRPQWFASEGGIDVAGVDRH